MTSDQTGHDWQDGAGRFVLSIINHKRGIAPPAEQTSEQGGWTAEEEVELARLKARHDEAMAARAAGEIHKTGMGH